MHVNAAGPAASAAGAACPPPRPAPALPASPHLPSRRLLDVRLQAMFRLAPVQLWIDNLADYYGNLNLLAADLFARVLRLEGWAIRATTVKFNRPRGASTQGDALEQQELRWAGAQPQAQEKEQQRQHGQQQLLLLLPREAAAAGRRQLAADGTESSAKAGTGGWGLAAKCWAVGVARRVGGDATALRLAPWVF